MSEMLSGNLEQLVRRHRAGAEDALVIARRVLEARLAESRKGSQQVADAYSRYLALKKRFEYSED
jgi:hypothetical protein